MAYTILLADDSPTIAKIMHLSLGDSIYHIETVTNGVDAEKALIELKPDYLLADFSLPKRSGLDLTHFIKKESKLTSTKVVLLTSAFDEYDEAECKNMGVDAILKKPFEPSELRKTLLDLAESTGEITKSEISLKIEPQDEASIALSSTLAEEVNQNLDQQDGFELNIEPNPTANFHTDALSETNDLVHNIDPSPGAAPQTTASEKLSPQAEELTNFLAAEVEKNNSETPAFVSQEVLTTQEDGLPSIAFDSGELQSELADWQPKQPKVDQDLSQWKSGDSPNQAFDIADSNFTFSNDYVQRMIRSTKNQINEGIFPSESDDQVSAPIRTQSIDSPPAKPASLDKAQRKDIEQIAREEIKLVCQEVAEKVAWEIMPELAENIIRKELEKIMSALEKDPQ